MVIIQDLINVINILLQAARWKHGFTLLAASIMVTSSMIHALLFPKVGDLFDSFSKRNYNDIDHSI